MDTNWQTLTPPPWSLVTSRLFFHFIFRVCGEKKGVIVEAGITFCIGSSLLKIKYSLSHDIVSVASNSRRHRTLPHQHAREI